MRGIRIACAMATCAAAACAGRIRENKIPPRAAERRRVFVTIALLRLLRLFSSRAAHRPHSGRTRQLPADQV